MYISAWGEDIVVDNTLSNDYLEVMMAGVTHPNPDYRIMHNVSNQYPYDYYVFEYVVKGVGHIETPNRKYTVKEGDFYFLNKRRHHVYYADQRDPYEKLFIVLKGRFVDFLVSNYGINDSVYITKCNVHGLMVHILNVLRRDAQLNYDQLALLVLELFQRVFPSPYIKALSSNRVPEMIKNYIDNHITEKITLEKISKSLYISKSYIERAFKNEYGQTPLTYASEQRMLRIAAMLETTDYSLSQIAHQFGFSDVKYMSKSFKKIMGKTPVEYRREKLSQK